MKRVFGIKADDGDVSVKVTVELTTGTSLTTGEVVKLKNELTDSMADAIRGRHFTNFGPHNTRVAR